MQARPRTTAHECARVCAQVAHYPYVRSAQVRSAPPPSITGTLPPEWAALSQLDTLSVARCGLTGSLPAAWGNGMARLRRLDATDNVAMGGPLPPEWGRLRALELL